jgi:hypothetical protein
MSRQLVAHPKRKDKQTVASLKKALVAAKPPAAKRVAVHMDMSISDNPSIVTLLIKPHKPCNFNTRGSEQDERE